MTDNMKVPEGWRRIRLGEVADVRLSNVDKKLRNNEIPVLLCNYLEVYQNEYITKSLEFMKGTVNRNELKKFKITRGDVIITKDSEDNRDIAKSAFVKEDIDTLVCGYHLALLKPKKGVDSLFLAKVLKLECVNKFFQVRANGITRFGLTKDTIETAKIPLPPLSEQRKIAEILEAIDNAIEKTDKIIEKYKRIKQGLMQDLLTKGIDENGQIRSEKTHKFKDSPLGRIPEEWEVYSVKQLIEKRIIEKIQDGNHGELHPKEDEFTDEGIPFITATDIVNNRVNLNSCKRLPEHVFLRLNKGLVKQGDLLLTHKGTIGLVSIFNHNIDAVLSPQVTFYRIRDQNFRDYTFHYFQSEIFKKQLDILSKQTTRDYIGLEKQKKLMIIYPKSKSEQKRIASILSQTDKAIEKEQKYKEKLERIKRGLMEDLLTGKVRVNHLIEDVKDLEKVEV